MKATVNLKKVFIGTEQDIVQEGNPRGGTRRSVHSRVAGVVVLAKLVEAEIQG